VQTSGSRIVGRSEVDFMDRLRHWLEQHTDEPIIVPTRPEKFVGVQAPHLVDVQHTATNFAEGNEKKGPPGWLPLLGPSHAGVYGAMKSPKDPLGGFVKGAGGWIKGAIPTAVKGAVAGSRFGPEGTLIGGAGGAMIGGPEEVKKEFVDQEQTTLGRFTSKSPTREEINLERKKSADVLRKWISGQMTSQDVSGDAPDSISETPEDSDVLKRFLKKQMYEDEREEHPTLDEATINQIIDDHFRKILMEG